jgi:hypothetical protein
VKTFVPMILCGSTPPASLKFLNELLKAFSLPNPFFIRVGIAYEPVQKISQEIKNKAK